MEDGTPSTSRRERGVSEVIGTVLMFALIVSLVGVVQVTAVPELTADAEFEHNQRLQGQLVDFSSAVSRTAGSGTGETVSIQLGVRYPQRVVLVNPPPASGTLATTPPAPVTIEHAVAGGEARDVWNGSVRTFQSRAITYDPAYNEYDTAPLTAYRTSIVSNRFDGATRVVAAKGFINGRQLSLTLLAGELRQSGIDRTSIDTRPLSTPARTVTVMDDNEPITVTVPTELSEEQWATLLATERVENGGHVVSHECANPPPEPCGRLTVVLEPGVSYELQLAQVGVGNNASAPEPRYLIDTAGDNASLAAGTRQRLAATVLDRFDNPVSGVETTVTVIDGPGEVFTLTDRSGADGEVAALYRAPSTVEGVVNVTVELSFGTGPARTVTYDLQVFGRGPASGGGGGSSSVTASITDATGSSERGTDRFDVTATAADSNGSLTRMTFELIDPEDGTVIDTAERLVSGGSAEQAVTLRARGAARRSSYLVRVTAVADDGDTAVDERTVTAG